MTFKIVTLFCSFAIAFGLEVNDKVLECPFPEGQDVATEEKCGDYSACQWTDGLCHMRSNDEAGYYVSGQMESNSRGFKVNLQKKDMKTSLFGGDVETLVFEVIHHENHHLQIKIYDPETSRFEVPIPLRVPDTPGVSPLYNVKISSEGQPFDFHVTRAANGNSIFHSIGPLTFEDQFLQLHTQLASSYLYGFGENPHSSFRHVFDPRTTFPIFARDRGFTTEHANLYGSHPYYTLVEDNDGNTHSVLLYTSNAMEYSTFLLPGGEPALTLRTIGGIIDLHFFLGPSPEDVNSQYSQAIGTTHFPPYWSLGFQLSRWGYNSTTNIRKLQERMRFMNIPQDVQMLDIDYMDGKHDFTFDPDHFHDLPELVQELHNHDLKVVIILDPALITNFDTYGPSKRGKASDVFLKWMDQDLVPDNQKPECEDYMVGHVWPAEDVVFPDFLNPETKKWWANELKLFKKVIDYDGVWIDMNEPSNFDTNQPWSLQCPKNHLDVPPYPTQAAFVGDNKIKRLSEHSICMSGNQTDGDSTFLHYDVHSLYGWSEIVATAEALKEINPEKRPMVLTRSTFPGSGHFGIHWLGDNTADWEHMRMSIIGMLEFNMFGIPMVGADICGFFEEPDMEMCARWMQLGAFYPFCRNHNTLGLPDQDPTAWPEVAEVSRSVLSLRYKYLPYLYTLFHKAHMHGSSVVRPLWNVFPSDVGSRDVDDQFLWGNGLMVAPVITPGATTRDIYFPQGLWYDLVSGQLEAKEGPITKRVEAPLKKIPVYVRGGIILPFQKPSKNTVQSRRNPFGLTVALAEDGMASGSIFWDDGDGNQSMMKSYMAWFSYAQGELKMSIKHGAGAVAGLDLDSIVILGSSNAPTSIQVNGQNIVSWSYSNHVITMYSLKWPMDKEIHVQIKF
ncbi:sucrase-isomaltase, intestinal-like [Oratosquilla oratoria]|uniref:sucrase-isomaltase, intestinal-like n=1 Tax=Oratosquilla oratoria TaxID=337810 RepID=UPI003F7735F9